MCLCLLKASKTEAVEIKKAYWSPLQNVMKAPLYNGTWIKTSAGYRFKEANGTAIKSRWIKVGNYIYYLNRRSCRVTGWIQYRGNLYYTSRRGRLQTGWLGKRYYLPQTGTYAKGFLTIEGKTFYFKPSNGRRVIGWNTIGEKTYYFNSAGVMVRDRWVKRDGKKYRFGPDGAMLKSTWVTVNGNQYYLNENGTRLFGNHYIDGEWRHFNKYAIYDPDYKFWDVVDPNKPMVALTFDDGPSAYTGRLLDCLEQNHGRATFFMVGQMIGSYPSALQRMVSLHCELGNHSWSHPTMTTLSNAAIYTQFADTSAKIHSACGKYPTLARLPYGDGYNNSRVLSQLSWPSIMWSVDTLDWANTGNPQHTINEVLNHAQNGDIILMHDLHRSTVIACETIIPALINRGFQLVTVSELAQYKGKTTMQAGRTYYSFK